MNITEKFSKAVQFAVNHHQGQKKKMTENPFIFHPLAVASFVMQYGGNEDQAMAAVLHDTIGDLPQSLLEKQFGTSVADLAFGFADPEMPADLTWKQSKQAYLDKVKGLDEKYVLIIACEELHDGRELAHDLKNYGDASLSRYPVPPRDVLWYYESLAKIFAQKKIPDALKNTFAAMLKELSEVLR